MEFADGRCCFCGAGFGEEKPKEVTEVDKPYTTQYGRVVQLVAPCPSCGKNIPLWAGAGALPEQEPEPAPQSSAKSKRSRKEEPEPTAPEPAPEPTEPEATEPTEPEPET